jgi:hypothetical protein
MHSHNTGSEKYHETLIEYIHCKRSYSNLLVAKKKKHYSSIETRLSNVKYPSDFFKALSCYRPKYQNIQNSNSIEPLVFAQYFSKKFDLCESSCLIDKPYLQKDAELDNDFTFDELENAIKKLSQGKAAGSDGIPNEVWKSLSVEQKLYLLDSFNLS